MIRIGEASSSAAVDAAIAIQLRVFCEEQGISEADCLEDNEDSLFLVAYDGDDAVGTARLRDQGNGQAEVARIAVLPAYRGSGIADRLLRKLDAIASSQGVRRLVMHPHARLEGFYARLGYAITDDESYYVGEHLIITMDKHLTGQTQ